MPAPPEVADIPDLAALFGGGYRDLGLQGPPAA